MRAEVMEFMKELEFTHRKWDKKPVFARLREDWSDLYEVTGKLRTTYDLGGAVENGKSVTVADRDVDNGKYRIAVIIFDRENKK